MSSPVTAVYLLLLQENKYAEIPANFYFWVTNTGNFLITNTGANIVFNKGS